MSARLVATTAPPLAAGSTEFPYRPPRICPTLYQCPIPDLIPGVVHDEKAAATGQVARESMRTRKRGGKASAAAPAPDLRPGQISVSEGLVWNPDVSKHKAVDAFLLFGRSLVGQPMVMDPSRDSTFAWNEFDGEGCEADERLLHCLQQHAGNLNRAQLVAASSLSMEQCARSAEVWRHKACSLRRQFNLWQAYYSRAHLPLGTFEVGEYKGDYAYSVDDSLDAEGKDEASSAEKAKRGMDNDECLAQWESLLTTAQKLLPVRGGSSRKPDLADCLEVLLTASQLPLPVQAPGDDLVETIQKALSQVEVLAEKGRVWLGNTIDTLCPASNGKKATVSELEKLVSSAETLPVTVREAKVLVCFAQQASSWQDRAQRRLRETSSGRSHSSSIGVSLGKLEKLVEEAAALPVELGALARVKDKCDTATRLQNELRQMFPVGKRSEKKPPVGRVREICTEVTAAGVDYPEAREVVKLVKSVDRWFVATEAAVAGPVGMKELQALRSKAATLPVDLGQVVTDLDEKLEKANSWLERVKKAVPKQRTSRRKSDDVTEGVVLSEVKGLLSETVGVEMDDREIGQMNELVETAEDWLSRVREALESGEVAALHELEELLQEAQGIPVTMDEKQVLTVGVKARQWQARVHQVLSGGSARLGELKKLAADAAQLRSIFPASAKSSSLLNFLESDELSEALRLGESWMNKARRIASELQNGKPVPRRRVAAVIEESQAVPLHLQPELENLKTLLKDMEEWVNENAELLSLCIPEPAEQSEEEQSDDSAGEGEAGEVKKAEPAGMEESLAGGNGDGEGDADAVMEDASGSHEKVEKMDVKMGEKVDEKGEEKKGEPEKMEVDEKAKVMARPKERVALSRLTECLEAADELPFGRSLVEIRDLREIFEQVNEWVERARNACPSQEDARKSANATKPTFDDLDDVLAEGEGFTVCVDEEATRLVKHIAAAKAWQLRARTKLLEVTRRIVTPPSAVKVLPGDGPSSASTAEKGLAAPVAGPTTGVAPAVRPPAPAIAQLAAGAATTAVAAPGGAAAAIISAAVATSSAFDAAKEPPVKDSGSETVQSKPSSEVKKAAAAAAAAEVTEEAKEAKEAENVEELGERCIREVEDLLSSMGDINIFMFEEVAAQRLLEVIRWGARVEEYVEWQLKSEGIVTLDAAKKVLEQGAKLAKGFRISNDWSELMEVRRGIATAFEYYGRELEDVRKQLAFAKEWVAHAKSLMAADKHDFEEMQRALRDAEGTELEEEDLARRLKSEIQRYKSWNQKASNARTGKKLELGQVKKLITEGERLRVSGVILADLKQHHRAAVRWLQQVKKTGIERGKAIVGDLRALIPEGEAIRVDLSEQITVLKQATSSYCLCYRAAEGFMVDCTICNRSFHGACISLEEGSARAAAPYRCIRCRATQLFHKAENGVLSAFSKWLPYTRYRIASARGFPDSNTSASTAEIEVDTGNFIAVAKVVQDAMGLPWEYVRTSLRVLEEVGSNRSALEKLHWGAASSAALQHSAAKEVLDSLQALVWCTMLHWVLRRRPQFSAIQSLAAQGKLLQLHDKELNAEVDGILKRASDWKAVVESEFHPPASSQQADTDMDVEKLAELLAEVKNIPVQLSEENKLQAAIDDGGHRYCICHGPNDGGLMVGCDVCEGWFHAHCVNVKTEDSASLHHYECPSCCAAKGAPYKFPSTGLGNKSAPAPPQERPPILDDAEGDQGPEHGSDEQYLWPPEQISTFLLGLSDHRPAPKQPQERVGDAFNPMHGAQSQYQLEWMHAEMMSRGHCPPVQYVPHVARAAGGGGDRQSKGPPGPVSTLGKHQ
ncbi:unnamed protein product, partial [Chrysoparadoxa australica]